MSESLHVVCSHCGGVNRIPRERLAQHPKCGKCKQPLFAGTPAEVDDAMLQKQIQRSDIPVVVDFWAPWCGPCKMMAPAFAQATAQLEPQVRMLKLNTEQHQQLAGQLGIRSIPTMILFRNGQEVDRMSGALDARGIASWVSQKL
ncbi:thioredoxin TrxC [Thiolapillus sp.]|uniref:Thioredoxin n=1 Tax=Thiolapillus brandeum TaxID=1076588 RepID=A0A831WAA6_9GAMM|nr:thioredoxin TrxC [Thiolapillus sp.]HEC06302.1 thioredoxin TrxC [Thiolapillus brandeum]